MGGGREGQKGLIVKGMGLNGTNPVTDPVTRYVFGGSKRWFHLFHSTAYRSLSLLSCVSTGEVYH